MTESIVCTGFCNRTLEQNEDNFACRKIWRTFGKSDEKRFVVAWNKVCRQCMAKKASIAKQKRDADRQAYLAAHPETVITCNGMCGKPKTANTDNFHLKKDGKFSRICKVCFGQKLREYRKTSTYKAMRRRGFLKHRKRHKKHIAANSARSRKYYEKNKKDPEWRRVQKARNHFGKMVRAGKIRKPHICSVCNRGPHNGYDLRMRFLTRECDFSKVEWLCAPHHWERTAGARRIAELAEERREDARSGNKVHLVIDPTEWREIHQQHILQAEREFGAPDPEYAAQVKKFKRLFRPIVNQERRAPRFSDLMFEQALGGTPE